MSEAFRKFVSGLGTLSCMLNWTMKTQGSTTVGIITPFRGCNFEVEFDGKLFDIGDKFFVPEEYTDEFIELCRLSQPPCRWVADDAVQWLRSISRRMLESKGWIRVSSRPGGLTPEQADILASAWDAGCVADAPVSGCHIAALGNSLVWTFGLWTYPALLSPDDNTFV